MKLYTLFRNGSETNWQSYVGFGTLKSVLDYRCFITNNLMSCDNLTAKQAMEKFDKEYTIYSVEFTKETI